MTKSVFVSFLKNKNLCTTVIYKSNTFAEMFNLTNVIHGRIYFSDSLFLVSDIRTTVRQNLLLYCNGPSRRIVLDA